MAGIGGSSYWEGKAGNHTRFKKSQCTTTYSIASNNVIVSFAIVTVGGVDLYPFLNTYVCFPTTTSTQQAS